MFVFGVIITYFYISGRDPADKLQHINLPIFDGDDCRKRYASQGAYISTQSQLCAGGEEGRDSCSGDSGSVLMTRDTLPNDLLPSWKFIGVVSFGPKTCGTKNMPGVYAKVRFYIDWILDNVEE